MQVKLTSVMSNAKFHVQCEVLSCFAGVFTATIGFLGDWHNLVRLHEVPPPQRSGWLNHLGAQLHPRPHPSRLGPPGGAVFENKHKHCPTGPRNEGGAWCAAVAWCVAAPTTSGLNHQVAHATSGPTPQHQGHCKGTRPLDSGFKRARGRSFEGGHGVRRWRGALLPLQQVG